MTITSKLTFPDGDFFGAVSYLPGIGSGIIVPLDAIEKLSSSEIGDRAKACIQDLKLIIALEKADYFDYRIDRESLDILEEELKYFSEFVENDERISSIVNKINSRILYLKNREINKQKAKHTRKEIQKNYDKLFVSIGKRDGFVCKKCSGNKDLQVDHIHPVSLGGNNDIDNLQLLCSKCNREKSNREEL